MLIDQLNRVLDMHRRKLASLEKNVGVAQERVQKQQEIIHKLELEIKQLSAGSRTQQLQEKAIKHCEEQIKQLSKKLEQVTKGEHAQADKDSEEVAGEEQQPQEEQQKKSNHSAFDIVGVAQELVPLQEIIKKLQQVTEINQHLQKETKSDGTGRLTKEEAGQAESAKTVEEQGAEEYEHPQEEQQKKSNLSEFDIVGISQGLAPLQELIIKLQQKITEINQRSQKETNSDEMGRLSQEEVGQAESVKTVEEQVSEENQPPQEEGQNNSTLSAFDIVGVPQGLAPLQELIIKLQQKITEVNQRHQKEINSDGMGLLSQEEEPKKSNLSAFDMVGAPQGLAPLQELIIKLQQKIVEINQRPQNQPQSDEVEQVPQEE